MAWIDTGFSGTNRNRLQQLGRILGDDSKGKYPYRQIGIEFKSRDIKIANISTLNVSGSNDGRPHARVTGQLQCKSMLSVGEGSLPLYHHMNVSDSHLGRGVTSQHGEGLASYYTILKSDIYIDNLWDSFRPGIFSDAVIHKPSVLASSSAQENSHSRDFKIAATVGVSLSFRGIRLDAGCPVNNLKKMRIYFGLDR